MDNIGIIGHFAFGKQCYDGQTVKTKILEKELSNIIGEEKVYCVDTYRWKKNCIKTLFQSIYTVIKCKHNIIILSKNGRNFFIPILLVIKKIFKKKLYCIVIGGAFPDEMKNNKFVSFFAKNLDYIFVETKIMSINLKRLGYKNILILNNSKKLNILDIDSIKDIKQYPFRICTFSRICKEKGIEDIIEVVEKINDEKGDVLIELDIYGQVTEDYKERFPKILGKTSSCIKYKGAIEYDKSVSTIKDYYILCFPTLFKTEGIPGTIIDAFSSAVPVLVSRWDSYSDIVTDGETGISFELGDNRDLYDKLKWMIENPQYIYNMKFNCVKKASEYDSEKVTLQFLEAIKYYNS